MKIIKNPIVLLVLLLISISASFAQSDTIVKEAQTFAELQTSINDLLRKTKTPGAAIVLVQDEETVLMKCFGKADVENNIDVDKNTMFRLGSISKLFVGLAVLKLQEEGRLNLKDKIKDVIPQMEIINPWEEEYPIRIENLLEHTAGLNDWSFAEIGSNDPKPKTLKESLEYYPRGRVAKYAPGTRTQYSNLSTSMAAYVVETVSGLSYEDYIATNFFKPLGMDNMTFRYSEQFKKTGAVGYDYGVPLSIDYLHILYRPSAALNASPNELLKLIRFFINRGKINDLQIISDSSMQRMERKESLHMPGLEMFKSYGLANSSTRFKGFVYQGHGGSVPGYNSDFAYLPVYNRGYAIMINGNDQSVVRRISKLIKAYQTQDLPQEIKEPAKPICSSTLDLSGYYIAVNYKFDVIKFFLKIKSIEKFWYENDTLNTKYALAQDISKYYATANNEFTSVSTNRVAIIPINDPTEGPIIYDNGRMIKKISSIYAYAILTLFWASFFIPISIILFAVLSLLIYLFGKNKNKTALWISLWPLFTISTLFLTVVLLIMNIQIALDAFLLLGNWSVLSSMIFIGTLSFAAASFWTLYYIIKNFRVKMSRIFYYHSILVAVFNLILTLYFISNGLIGIPTWM